MTSKKQQNSSENIPTALTSSRSGRTVNNEIPPLPPPGGDEGGDASPFVQTGIARKNLQAASVTYLDGGVHAFYVHKNSTAEVLFEMVCAHLGLNEKDYFGLFFYDEQAARHTLYKDKIIAKQLKVLPWRFFFEVKFYPPQPAQLTEDLTRYLLRLQLRQDIFEERLPTSFAMQAKLGALNAQVQFGDYQPTDAYAQFLRGAEFAQIVTEQLLEKIVDVHKQYRGLTASEAELVYLNECKELAMYGVILHPAKDSKGKPTQIGVSAHGISVYNDQMRVHRFAWPNIIKFSYRRNIFTVKLKPGELEKKDTTAIYKLIDHPAAKRLWKCAVEHHTFFRLIQPESKPKSSLLRFGSSRFRYYGRTNFQTQMASQLIDGAQSARVASKSFDNITTRKHEIQPTATLETTSRDLTGSLLRDGGKVMSTARSARLDANNVKVGGQYAPHEDKFNAELISTPSGTAGHLTKMSALIARLATTTVAATPHWSSVSRYDSTNDSLTAHTTQYSIHAASREAIALASDNNSINKDDLFGYRQKTSPSYYSTISSSWNYGLANNSYYSQTQFNDSGCYATASSPDADFTYSITSGYSPISRNEMGLAESTITDIFMTPLCIAPVTTASKPNELSPYECDLPKSKILLKRDSIRTRVTISDRLNQKLSPLKCTENVLTLDKIPELPLMPLKARVTVYNSGWYDRAIQNDVNLLGSTRGFVKSHNSLSTKRITTGDRFLKSKEIIMMDKNYTHRNCDIMPHQLKYFVRTYHSGFSVDPQRYSYKRADKKEFRTNANKDDYKIEFLNVENQRLEKTEDLESVAIEYYVRNWRSLKCHQRELKEKSNQTIQNHSTPTIRNSKKKCSIIIKTSKLAYLNTAERTKNGFTIKRTSESVPKDEGLIGTKKLKNVQMATAESEQKEPYNKLVMKQSPDEEVPKMTNVLEKKQKATLTISRKLTAQILLQRQLSKTINTVKDGTEMLAISKLLLTDISKKLEPCENAKEITNALFTPETTSSYMQTLEEPHNVGNEKIRDSGDSQLRMKKRKSKVVLILKRRANFELKGDGQGTTAVANNAKNAQKTEEIICENRRIPHFQYYQTKKDTIKTNETALVSILSDEKKVTNSDSRASTSQLRKLNETSDIEEVEKKILTKKLKAILIIAPKDSSKHVKDGSEQKEQRYEGKKRLEKVQKLNVDPVKKSRATLTSLRKELPQTENTLAISQKEDDLHLKKAKATIIVKPITKKNTVDLPKAVSAKSKSMIKDDKESVESSKQKSPLYHVTETSHATKLHELPSVDFPSKPWLENLTKIFTENPKEDPSVVKFDRAELVGWQKFKTKKEESICKKGKAIITINTVESRKNEIIDDYTPHQTANKKKRRSISINHKFDKMHKRKAIITLRTREKTNQVYDAEEIILEVAKKSKTNEVRKLKNAAAMEDKTIRMNRHSQNILKNDNINKRKAYEIDKESDSYKQSVGRKQKAIITMKPVSEIKSTIGTIPEVNRVDILTPRKLKRKRQTDSRKMKALLAKKPVANIETKQLHIKAKLESPIVQSCCKNNTAKKDSMPKKAKALLILKRSQKNIRESELSGEMMSQKLSSDPNNKTVRISKTNYIYQQKKNPPIKSSEVEVGGKKKALIKLKQSNINDKNKEAKIRQTSEELYDTIVVSSKSLLPSKSTETDIKPEMKNAKRVIVRATPILNQNESTKHKSLIDAVNKLNYSEKVKKTTKKQLTQKSAAISENANKNMPQKHIALLKLKQPAADKKTHAPIVAPKKAASVCETSEHEQGKKTQAITKKTATITLKKPKISEKSESNSIRRKKEMPIKLQSQQTSSIKHASEFLEKAKKRAAPVQAIVRTRNEKSNKFPCALNSEKVVDDHIARHSCILPEIKEEKLSYMHVKANIKKKQAVLKLKERKISGSFSSPTQLIASPTNKLVSRPHSVLSQEYENTTKKHRAILLLKKKALFQSAEEIRANAIAKSFHSNKENFSSKKEDRLQRTESEKKREKKQKAIITLKEINDPARLAYLKIKKQAMSHEKILFASGPNKNKSVADTKSDDYKKISIIIPKITLITSESDTILKNKTIEEGSLLCEHKSKLSRPFIYRELRLSKLRKKKAILVIRQSIFYTSAAYEETFKNKTNNVNIKNCLTKNDNEKISSTKHKALKQSQIYNEDQNLKMLSQQTTNSDVGTNPAIDYNDVIMKECAKSKEARRKEIHSPKKPKAVLSMKPQKANQLVSFKTINSHKMEQDNIVSTNRRKEKRITSQKSKFIKVERLPKFKNENVIENTNKAKETAPKKNSKQKAFENAIRFKKSKAILTLKQSRNGDAMSSRTKISEKNMATTHIIHLRSEMEKFEKFIDIKLKGNTVMQMRKEKNPTDDKKSITLVSEPSVVKLKQKTAGETFREHLRKKTLNQKKKKAVITLKRLARNNKTMNMWNKINAEKENEPTIYRGEIPKQRVTKKRHQLVAKMHNAASKPTVRKQKAIIAYSQRTNLKPIMSKIITSSTSNIRMNRNDNNEKTLLSIVKEENETEKKRKQKAILTLRQQKAANKSSSHKCISESAAVKTRRRRLSETSSIIRNSENVSEHVEILSKPVALLYLKGKNKWINAEYAHYVNKNAQSPVQDCKNQVKNDFESIAQISCLQNSECIMQSVSDEFASTECMLNVSLMRRANCDYACTLFLGYRTPHFVSNDQRDGSIILPKALFMGSRLLSNAPFSAVARCQQKVRSQRILKANVAKDNINESNEREEKNYESIQEKFSHSRQSPRAVIYSAEKGIEKWISKLFSPSQQYIETTKKKEKENNTAHEKHGYKRSEKHSSFSISIKSGIQQTNCGCRINVSSSFPFSKPHDQLTTEQTHAETSYDRVLASYDGNSFDNDNSANKTQRSHMIYKIINKQIPPVLSVNTDKTKVSSGLFNPEITFQVDNSTEGSIMQRSRSSILQFLRKLSQRKSENISEGPKKKKDAKSKDEKAARNESGVDISSQSSTSSSSSSSDAEEVVEQPPHRNDIGVKETERTDASSPCTLTSSASAGPYVLAPVDGRIIREEKIEQIYRIVGSAGERIPRVDPSDASLSDVLSKCVAETTSAPKVTYVEERSVVRNHGAIPDLIIKEASLPHSTVHTWHEKSAGPETITTEVDEHGSVIKRTVVKSEQVKHTVRTQSYQTFVVDENTTPKELSTTALEKTYPTPHKRIDDSEIMSKNSSPPPITTTVAHTIAYENGTHQLTNGSASHTTNSEFTEEDLVSTKAVTTGNRTVETLTYKKEKDGIIETHVEHRITIHGGDDIDHDAELSRAILEATNMNPEMTVEKVEVRQKKTIS